ncbi:MAG TPA: hypothetical protein VNI58_09010, partial [Mariprofundaceae bacterium]|nr:hypothetical protein [Mariprofundaceae bacterium]
CLSQVGPIDQYAPGFVGRNIYEVIDEWEKRGDMQSAEHLWGWHDKWVQLEDGTREYVTMEAPNCWVHWKVGTNDLITGYTTEGDCNW